MVLEEFVVNIFSVNVPPPPFFYQKIIIIDDRVDSWSNLDLIHLQNVKQNIINPWIYVDKGLSNS